MTLKTEINLGSPGEFSVFTRVLHRGRARQRRRVSEREMWLLKEFGEIHIAGSEGAGGTGHRI